MSEEEALYIVTVDANSDPVDAGLMGIYGERPGEKAGTIEVLVEMNASKLVPLVGVGGIIKAVPFTSGEFEDETSGEVYTPDS